MRALAVASMLLALTACSGGDQGSGPSQPGPPDPGVPATTTMVTGSTTTTLRPTTTTTAPPLSVAGKVVDHADRPVANAVVSMGAATAVTGSDGFFDLLIPNPGTLTVSRPGWTSAEVSWAETDSFAQITIEPKRVRGIRVGAAAAGDAHHFDALLDLADATAVNALVFDTKQEGGKVLYDTAVEEAHDMGAVEVWYDPTDRLRLARERGLYAITRIAVFEDHYRAAAFPEERLAGGWIDPRSQTARDYNVALAAEACQLGFDEIQFDYVRFPAGRTAQTSGQLELAQEERVAAVEGFLSQARSALQPMGCAVSAAIFAIVASSENDQGLGQRPEEVSRQVDALSPMIYPSHYSPGWLGFDDPNEHPYDVTADAIEDSLARLATDAVLRPWLQAFWWSGAQIRRSIQAAEDRGVGWILWNIGSDFDPSSIPTDTEVEP